MLWWWFEKFEASLLKVSKAAAERKTPFCFCEKEVVFTYLHDGMTRFGTKCFEPSSSPPCFHNTSWELSHTHSTVKRVGSEKNIRYFEWKLLLLMVACDIVIAKYHVHFSVKSDFSSFSTKNIIKLVYCFLMTQVSFFLSDT